MPRSDKKRAAPEGKESSTPVQRAKKSMAIPSALDIGRDLVLARPVPVKPSPAAAAAKKKAPPGKKKAPPTAATTRNNNRGSALLKLATDLNETEARLWQQVHGAKCASHNHNPGRKVRLIGTITRTVTVEPSVDPFPSLEWNKGEKTVPYFMEQPVPNTFKIPTVSQAKKEVVRELPADEEITDGQLVLAANSLLQEWKHVLGKPYGPGWNERGELLDCPLEGSLRVSQVLRFFQNDILTDTEPDKEKDYYHGLRKIAIDTQTVLTSLQNFAVPAKALYGQPMVVALVIPNLIQVNNNKKTYRLTIPVYVHRLAFEILSLDDVHTIWSALDEGSYTVVNPLTVTPKVDQVFFSDPTPRVVIDDDEDEEESNDIIDLTDEVQEDILLENSTRRSDIVSAYTFPGFLKLLESPGCNVTAWPAIETKLQGKLQVKLLPHQKHGICWMIEQENINGGLNSLLWEERQFSGGQGSYFFSPACGQIRLHLGGKDVKQPDTTGGILADEMGLGKTVTLLALVLATKNDKKSSEDEPTTLVVVPPALLSQWKAETQKIVGTNLRTEVFNTDTLSFQPAFEGQSSEGNVDLVLTSYAALSDTRSARILRSHSWKRIVLDEMQELRSSTTKLAHNCQDLNGRRRWMLSGTPLFESIEDFRGELCFLGLEPFAATSEDGFFDFLIKSHWDAKSRCCIDTLRCLSLLMLRRSKAMTYMDPISKERLPLLGLPPITVMMEPVIQAPSERAVYCFLEYLVHSNLGKEKDGEETHVRPKVDEGKRKMFIKLLRESCLSLHLLSGGPGCPNRLETLDRIMVQHHRRSDNPSVEKGTRAKGGQDVLSVDEAVEFLSRVVDLVRVEDGMHTTQTVGGGFGRSRRDRAFESVDAKLAKAKLLIEAGEQEVKAAKSKRAKARWHHALEMITTGHLKWSQVKDTGARTSIRNLWRWRLSVAQVTDTRNLLPSFLCRGWRPTANFFRSKSFYRARDNWRKLLLGVVQGKAFRSNKTVISFGEESKLNENGCKNNGSECLSDDDSTAKTIASRPTRDSRKTRKYHALWRWRYLFEHIAQRREASTFPGLVLDEKEDSMFSLCRLSVRFPWAHPWTILLEFIPRCVSIDVVRRSILRELESSTDEKATPEAIRIFPVSKNGECWKAYVRFTKAADFNTFFARTKKRDGAALLTDKPLPRIVAVCEEASERLKDATAAWKVYPNDDNTKKLAAAKRSESLAKLGLRMHFANKREGHVKVSRSCPQIRSDSAVHSSRLVKKCLGAIIGCGDDLDRQQSVVTAEKHKVLHLEKAQTHAISKAVQNLSTFEILEVLKAGDREKTSCPVCLCPLGGDESSEGKVAMTRCGHVFCTSCLEDYFRAKRGEGNHTPSCIACRKKIRRSDSVIVDPSLNDDDAQDKKRSAARSLVREISEKLEKSNGQLEPYLWEALYLSHDIPSASKARNPSYTAIPGELLAHLRHATGLSLSGRIKGDIAEVLEANLSSKIRKLLDDLPRNEKSVVFTTTASSIKHIFHVLQNFQFPVCKLFSGQTEVDSRTALDQWRSTSAGVLLVQAGAAACGLTLTDAAKMFIMEPLLRYEQERQAYSRLHRYGQTKEVTCKVYYAPISVEERLLEWRKKEKSSEEPDEKVVFSQLKCADDEEDEGEDDNDEDEDITQSRFLLGLDHRDEARDMEE